MASPLREDLVDSSGVGGMHDLDGTQAPLTLGALLGENMAVIGAPMLELARGRLLEALGGASVCLHFRHDRSSCPGLAESHETRIPNRAAGCCQGITAGESRTRDAVEGTEKTPGSHFGLPLF